MALITITIQDGADGQCTFSVNAEPALPRSVMDGAPSKAQAAAALMLNALNAKLTSGESVAANEPSRIITLN